MPHDTLSRPLVFTASFLLSFLIALTAAPQAGAQPADPGPRGGPPGAGGPLPGLSSFNLELFAAGRGALEEVDSVQGTIPGTRLGLGPRFNMDSCGGCHANPAPGGSSPAVNPQVAVATKEGASNTVPFFITIDGPVRGAHVTRQTDTTPAGSGLDLYTIAGRVDAPGCTLAQPDFEALGAAGNLAFHIPLALYGLGLVEAIDDDTILANQSADSGQKQALGIGGHPGRGDAAGRVGRFGWKAQGNALPIFVAGAYDGEVGVTSPLFPVELDRTPGCQFNRVPEDRFNLAAPTLIGRLPDVTTISAFVRFLAPPTPAPDTPSIAEGRGLFSQIGCALCHTPTIRTGVSTHRALSGKAANLYSDLLLHRMGPALADGIARGNAGPDEFRTTPLWGVGQRLFFLHDGRTTDLLEAISAHASDADQEFPASEANVVIGEFNALSDAQKQSLLDFLRAL